MEGREGVWELSVLSLDFSVTRKQLQKSLFIKKKKQKEKKLNILAFIISTITASQIIMQFPCTNCIYTLFSLDSPYAASNTKNAFEVC